MFYKPRNTFPEHAPRNLMLLTLNHGAFQTYDVYNGVLPTPAQYPNAGKIPYSSKNVFAHQDVDS